MVSERDQCAGCARTSREIAEWSSGTDTWRQMVWAALPDRLRIMGVTVQRLQMDRTDIVNFIEGTVQGASGTWVLGVYGGVGEFNRDKEEPFEIRRDQYELTAVTNRAALRLSVGPTACLMAIGEDTAEKKARAYCLAVPKSRICLPVRNRLSSLGIDLRAIRPENSSDQLFDLGLGRGKARFCLRTQDPELLAALREAEGLVLTEMIARVGPAILQHNPTRVVETLLGRVEVATPIPSPGDRSPSGPHTHLLPDHLAEGIEGAPGLAIPEAYTIGGLFYPRRA